MIFDKLCGFAERHIPPLRAMCESAALFSFPGRAHEILKEMEYGDVKELVDSFFLPFHCTAIEDTASCILIEDEDEAQVGFSKPRTFIECYPIFGTEGEFADSTPSPSTAFFKDKGVPSDTYVITVGTLSSYQFQPTAERNPVTLAGNLEWWAAVTKDQIILPQQRNRSVTAFAGIEASAIRNVGAAIEEVCWFNQPARFVVESLSMKARSPDKAKKAGKILRSDDRPRYTTLYPREIQHLLPSLRGSHSSPGSHARRRHFRTYNAERYSAMKGKTVIIPATWVGPTETEMDGRRYKIRLDI